jgi:hypothetical protein
MTTIDKKRDRLDELRLVIDDSDLRGRIGEYIEASYRLDNADSAAEYIEHELDRMLAEYEMYDSPYVPRGEDAFPKKCEDCLHYPHACPILRDRTQKRWRERKLEEASSSKEELDVYRKQARDVGCHVIPELSSEWQDGYQQFLVIGERLLQLALADSHDEEPPEDYSEAELSIDDIDVVNSGATPDAGVASETASDTDPSEETQGVDIGPSMDDLDESVLDDENLDSANPSGTGGVN